MKRWFMRKFWFDWPIGRAAVVTVISEETKRQLLLHLEVAHEKIVVVPNAAGPVFRPCPKQFSVECPRILQIGTKDNKNVPRLIEALEGIRCKLHIVGPVNESLRQLLERSGIAYDAAAGLNEAEIYRAYCEADIVTLVSTYEGFGMPIVEAQWVERPVVTSNCSSMPEVAGEGAHLVDPFDLHSIRNGIERVIADAAHRERIVEHGRRNRERFALPSVAAQYLRLYESVAASVQDAQKQ